MTPPDFRKTLPQAFPVLAERQVAVIAERKTYANGDVRCDSVKRVASAIGEGAIAAPVVHEYLKESEI